MIKHILKSSPTKDSRLEPCPICGSDMLGRFKSGSYGPAWVFSCSNEDCILHRMKNNIRIPALYNSQTKHSFTEDEAINMMNRRYK